MDKFEVADKYEAAFQEHGQSVHALNWTNTHVQKQRMLVLLEALELEEHHTHEKLDVLDVGCGFGDLLTVPGIGSWMRSYTGLDTNSHFIHLAEKRYRDVSAQFYVGDITDDDSRWDYPFDFVIANGTLAFYDIMPIHLMVAAMWKLTKKVLAFNFTRNDNITPITVYNLMQYIGCDRYVIRRDHGTLGEISVYCYPT